MPDKLYNIDKSFTDRGWSEMKKLLDREMPVPPVPFFRRRKNLLWLLLLLVPLGLAWGYFQWNPGKTVPVPEKPSNNIPSPTVSPVVVTEPAVQNAETAISGPVTDASASEPAPAPIAVAEISEPPAGIVKLAPAVPALRTLPLRPDARQYRVTTVAISLPVKVQKNEIPSGEWGFGMEAGPLASADFNSYGMTTSLVAGKNFGKSRWGFQSGLGYARLSSPFPSQTLSQNLEVADFEDVPFDPTTNILIGSESDIRAVASSTDSAVSRLHYLEIPLSLTFQSGKRWQFQAGPGFDLLLVVQNEEGRNSGEGLIKSGAFELDSANNPIYGAASPSPFIRDMRMLHPFIGTGLTFYPVPRLGIGASFNFGLVDLLPRWPGNQYVNKAQVKVSYWIR